MILSRRNIRVTGVPDATSLRHRLAAIVLVFGAIMISVAVLPALEEVRRRFADAAPGWLVLSLLLQAASCLAFIAVFRGVFCRRLDWRSSYHLGMTVQGTNVLLPTGGAGGLALGAWVLNHMGVPGERLAVRSVAFFLLTSGVNFLTAALVGGGLALGLLAGGVSPALTAVPALLAGTAILLVGSLPRILPRPPGGDGRASRALTAVHNAVSNGVREAGTLLTSGNPVVVAGALGYMCLDVAALGAAFAALGALPPIALFLLAYVVGQLGGLVPLPGGVGGTDGGLIAALALYGTPLGEAAAAVLAYRAFQLGLPALLGTLSITRLPGLLSRRLEPELPAEGAAHVRTPVAA